MTRLPKQGEDDWGDVLNGFLKQSLAPNGQLITGATNPHNGAPNTNLANNDKPGLVQLTGDLSNNAHVPQVSGLQGNPVASTNPTHGQVLTWNAQTGAWEPGDAPNPLHQAMIINSIWG